HGNKASHASQSGAQARAGQSGAAKMAQAMKAPEAMKASHATKAANVQPPAKLPHDAAAMQSAQPNVTATAARPAPGVSGLRTAPVTAPSAPATHTGRGDATLARYMSELAGYELLGRDDEIKLAQEVEQLEIAYWRALLALPRAFAMLEPVILSKLEEQPPT